MKIKKISIIVLIAIFALCITVFAVCYYKSQTLYTSGAMSLDYSRSATNFHTENRFFVHENVLYFTEEVFGKHVLRYVKNGRMKTVTKIPDNYEKFEVLDNNRIIIELNDYLYLLNTKSGERSELWQGCYSAYYGEQIYFTRDSSLYASTIGGEPKTILHFDELLASYNDCMVYRIGESIYRFFYGSADEPQQLTDHLIPWDNGKQPLVLDIAYLYSEKYALCIHRCGIDMYIYETHEMKSIYKVDAENIVAQSVVTNGDVIYVSRQCIDMACSIIKNKDINGTYKYDVNTAEWSKVSSDTFSYLSQFDNESLYGYSMFGMFDKVKRLNIK